MKLLALLVSLPLLAGCLDGNDNDSDDSGGDGGISITDPYDPITAMMTGVPCESSGPVGADTTDNLRLLSNITVGASDIDIRNGRIVTTSSLVDARDPLNMRILANWSDFELKGGGDAKWMSDNESIILGGGGVYLINVEEPTLPYLEDAWEFTEFGGVISMAGSPFLNAHMLYTERIAGEDWIFIAPNTNTGVWILKVVGEIGSRTLEYVTQTLPVEGGPLGPHDMYITKDDFTSDWLLYSADGYHGWTVFDINDPAAPTPVGGIVRPETGYTHTIQAANMGERRIVVTIQEVGNNIMEVYDATLLQAPILLATWQSEVGETTPQHNFNIVNGTIYLAHYSYGMWVFDISDAGDLPLLGTTEFGPVAHYDPNPGGIARPVPLAGGEFEAVYDVVLQDGILYIAGYSDPVVGIHVVGYGCNQAGDSTLTSTG